MKKHLCKILACMTAVMALGSLNMADVKAETNSAATWEQDNATTPLSPRHYTTKELQHHFYVNLSYLHLFDETIMSNTQTTNWVYDATSVGLLKSPTNIIVNKNSNAQFFNGHVMDNNIVGQYTYGGDVYYEGAKKGSVAFSTTMKTTGEYFYSGDPTVYY